MADLNGMSVFVAVAEAGSLTGAGKTLSLPKSTISRHLRAYEESIGTTLFRRSTRSISLTDAGKRHFDRVQLLVHEASEAIFELAEQTAQPAGLIRISASLTVGANMLAQFVWEFLEQHPKVRVEMILTDAIVDLVSEGIDFSLRMGELQDSELMAKTLGKGRRIVVASPGCLERYGIPAKPDDLRRMPAIVTTAAQGFWRFDNGDVVRVNWRIAAGTHQSALQACLLGHGVALLPETELAQHLGDGALVKLLEDFPTPEVSISLVYPRIKHQSAAARAFQSAIGRFKLP